MIHEHIFREHPGGGLVCHGCNSFFGVEWATGAIKTLRAAREKLEHCMNPWEYDVARASKRGFSLVDIFLNEEGLYQDETGAGAPEKEDAG